MNLLRRQGVLLICFVYGLLTLTAAQAQAPSNAPLPTLRATTRLVLVDVVVTDQQGKPIQGLGAGDFSVLEAGKPQKISVFTAEPEDSLPEASGSVLPPKLPAYVVTNNPAYHKSQGPLVLLLFDLLNTAAIDQAYVRQTMLQYLAENSDSRARFAVLVLGNNLELLQDFTSDRAIVRKALEGYKPVQAAGARADVESSRPKEAPDMTPSNTPADAARSGAAGALVVDKIRRFENEVRAAHMDERLRMTTAALDAIARAVEGYPGRKSLVWFSRGFPFNLSLENSSDFPLNRNYQERIQRTTNLFSDAQIAVYPIDAGGLTTGLPNAGIGGPDATIDGLSLGKPSASTGDPVLAAEQARREVTSRFELHGTMNRLAEDTGGRAFLNSNDIRGAVSFALEDAAATYLIGYYSSNKKWDRRFREIKVNVARRGAQVRHRRGYYAIDAAEWQTGDGENALRAALTSSPMAATALQFYARVPPRPAGEGEVVVEFLVDARRVAFEEAEGGAKYCNLEFQVAALTFEGRLVKAESETLKGTLKPATYEQFSRHGIPHRFLFKLPPGTYRLRLGVRDNHSGLFGTTETALVVERPKAN